MADRSTRTDSDGDTAYPGTPPWVKTSAIVVLVLAVLVVVVMAIAGGEHGPGRHVPSGGATGQAPPAGQVAPKP